MPFQVKLICEGVGRYHHKRRTVARFRYDGGWARTHNEGALDTILWEPPGEVTVGHRLDCDRCPYDGYFKPDKLYPLLDEARTRGWMPVPR